MGSHSLLQGIFPTQRSIFLLFLVFNIEPTSKMKSLPPIALLKNFFPNRMYIYCCNYFPALVFLQHDNVIILTFTVKDESKM